MRHACGARLQDAAQRKRPAPLYHSAPQAAVGLAIRRGATSVIMDPEQYLALVFCHQHLARQKCPRLIDFDAELPRLPTGKLYKRVLRDRYWGDITNPDRVMGRLNVTLRSD